MKNTLILAQRNIVFDPYRYFPDSIKENSEEIIELYRNLSLFEMKDLLTKTKRSNLSLSYDEENERDQITFALFKRIEMSDPDALPVDSVLLAAKDPKTVAQLKYNETHNPANIATLGFIKPTIPSRYMRGFYQILLESGFIFEDAYLTCYKQGYDRELNFLHFLRFGQWVA